MRNARFGREWTDFVAWCRARRLRALPAHPWTVAAYARWCEHRHRLATIKTRIRSIGRAHLLNCKTPPDTHPIVTRTMRTIESRQRNKHAAKLFRDDDFTTKATSKPKAKKSSGSRKKVMRATPRLVRRHPSDRDGGVSEG